MSERCRFKSIQAVEVVPQMGSRLTNVQRHEKDSKVTISLAIWPDFSKNLLKKKKILKNLFQYVSDISETNVYLN